MRLSSYTQFLRAVALAAFGCQPAPLDRHTPAQSTQVLEQRTALSNEQGSADRREAPVLSEPAGLACLIRWYGGRAERRGDQWGMLLDTSEWLVFDDGEAKTIAQRIEHADLEDMLSQRYQSNDSDAPISLVDFDPGRARVEQLFKYAYGSSESDVSRHLVLVRILRSNLHIHQRAADALRGVARRLLALELGLPPKQHRVFVDEFENLGTFNWRFVAGTQRLSAHAFGIAVDLNPKMADYWRWGRAARWRQRMPAMIVRAFESEGFIWGGAWSHYDSMHFEYRPEMFDSKCFPAIDAGTAAASE